MCMLEKSFLNLAQKQTIIFKIIQSKFIFSNSTPISKPPCTLGIEVFLRKPLILTPQTATVQIDGYVCNSSQHRVSPNLPSNQRFWPQ